MWTTITDEEVEAAEDIVPCPQELLAMATQSPQGASGEEDGNTTEPSEESGGALSGGRGGASGARPRAANAA